MDRRFDPAMSTMGRGSARALALILTLAFVGGCKPSDEPARHPAPSALEGTQTRGQWRDAPGATSNTGEDKEPNGTIRLVAAAPDLALPADAAKTDREALLDDVADTGTEAAPDATDATDATDAEDIAAPESARRLALAAVPSPEDQRRANRSNKRGLARHRALDLKGAIESYEAALAAWPGHGFALYNVACAHALLGQRDAAIDALQSVALLPTETAVDRLSTARTDTDFEDLHDDLQFRSLTGFRPVAVAWSADLSAESAAKRVVMRLVEARVPAAVDGPFRTDVPNTRLFFREGDEASEALAATIAETLSSPVKTIASAFLSAERPVILVLGPEAITGADAGALPDGPAGFIGMILEHRGDGFEERLQLKRTDFFSWTRVMADGGRVVRTGRYLLRETKLSLDFRQVTERPTDNPAAPDIEVLQGRRTTHRIIGTADGITVDGIPFKPVQ